MTCRDTEKKQKIFYWKKKYYNYKKLYQMSNNQQQVNQPIEDTLVSNSELRERQIRWLMTVQSFLEMQLEQVQLELDKFEETHAK